jgi:hypothetical protein
MNLFGLWAMLLLPHLCLLIFQHQRLSAFVEVHSHENDLFATVMIPTTKPQIRSGEAQPQQHDFVDVPSPIKGGLRATRAATRNHTHIIATRPAHGRDWENTDRRLLVHLHISKAGGTSLDTIGPRLAHDSDRLFMGRIHFDWSYIDKLPFNRTDVITMLRDPVSRAVSHFYFSQQLAWTANKKIRNMRLGEYLQDKQELMQTRDLWYDGQASLSWLTGTHLSSWVAVSPYGFWRDVKGREQLASNATAMCLLAADRLDATLWFGIIEDLRRSMELLQHALGLSWLPEFPKSNSAKRKYPEPTEWEREVLASLMPQDLWLHEYGKRLFEARYQAMKTGVFIQPQRPPLPDMWSCKSNRTCLDCVEGPLKGSIEKATEQK